MIRILAIIINVLLLAYGLLRLGVGSAMLMQALGFLEIESLKEPLNDVAGFLTAKSDKQIVPVSVTGYVAFIALMGLALSLGALGSLTKKWDGLPLIGMFLLRYAGLFINFQTINPKIIHLAVCTVGFLCLVLIRRSTNKDTIR